MITLSVAVAIADALGISVGELAGRPSHRIKLGGLWWASWQTFRDGAEKIASQQVEIKQEGDLLQLATVTRGLAVEEGGYHWSGELRLWDNEVLMRWYAANDGSIRAKGTMYFVLHPHGLNMSGRWVGLGYDGRIMTGFGTMGQSQEQSEETMRRLISSEGVPYGAEVAEERVEVVTYAAAIDVAKASGMMCTRVPGSRPDRKRQTVWRAEATYDQVVALMDHLRCQGIERLVLESTSDYWRIWYYLAEAAGLQVWLVNAKDTKHLPGRGKSDREDCVWLCKLNERGMLRRSFVPPEAVRDLRSLTRTRSRLACDQARHQNRVEKILEDALLKISVVISDLFGASGRRFLDALVAGERSPAALAALGDPRLRASTAELEAALTGRFRDIHAFEIATHLRLIDTINDEIARLDARIGQQLASVPGVAPACTACGLIGGGHAPGCASKDAAVLGLVERLDEITGVGTRNAQVIIAELGTDMSVFPTAGHAAAWARLTPRTIQSGASSRPGRTGKGDPYLRAALGQCVMAASRTDTRLGEQYRRIAKHRGKQKGIVAVSRVICEIAWLLIGDRAARFTGLGPGYYDSQNPQRRTRSKIREIERLNPGMKVTLTPIDPAAAVA